MHRIAEKYDEGILGLMSPRQTGPELFRLNLNKLCLFVLIHQARDRSSSLRD